jgi:hypothetical protein
VKQRLLLFITLFLAASLVGFFAYWSFQQIQIRKAQEAERARQMAARDIAVQAIASLVREDKADIETMISTIYSENITVGDVTKEFERQNGRRQDPIYRARALDFSLLLGTRD